MNYTQTQEVNIAMNSNRDLFEKTSVPKAVALMAIPTIVTMLVVVIYNMADTFFIGQTGDAMQVAAVSLATPVFMVFMALGNLFGIGGSSAISRALGEKNEQRARHISAFCCYGSLGVGILMTLIFILFMDGILKMIGASPATIDYARQYLTFVAIGAPFVMFGTAYGNIVRGEGAAKESMIGNLIGTITNIILDPIMILWLGCIRSSCRYCTWQCGSLYFLSLLSAAQKRNGPFHKAKRLSMEKPYRIRRLFHRNPGVSQ